MKTRIILALLVVAGGIFYVATSNKMEVFLKSEVMSGEVSKKISQSDMLEQLRSGVFKGHKVSELNRYRDLQIHDFGGMAFFKFYDWNFILTIRDGRIADMVEYTNTDSNNWRSDCALAGQAKIDSPFRLFVARFSFSTQSADLGWRIDEQSGKLTPLSPEELKGLKCEFIEDTDHAEDIE